MANYLEILSDPYMVPTEAEGHRDELAEHDRFLEPPVQNQAEPAVSQLERGRQWFDLHRRGIAKIGGISLFGVGAITGTLVFNRH